MPRNVSSSVREDHRYCAFGLPMSETSQVSVTREPITTVGSEDRIVAFPGFERT